jgi:hypothetical protein
MRIFRAKSIIALFLALISGGCVMFGLSGCFAKKYTVDYCGQKSDYANARDSYRAGESVTLIFGMIATDTDYSFFLDDERISPDYDDKTNSYVIGFTMPDHDVKLECRSYNSMLNTPPALEEELLVNYYHSIVGTVGGDESDELALYKTGGDKYKLYVFNTDTDGNKTEKEHIVPQKAFERCREVIESEKLRDWSKIKESEGMTGALTVVKFKDGDSYIRVSTEKMPENGEQSLNKVKAVLEEYTN